MRELFKLSRFIFLAQNKSAVKLLAILTVVLFQYQNCSKVNFSVNPDLVGTQSLASESAPTAVAAAALAGHILVSPTQLNFNQLTVNTLGLAKPVHISNPSGQAIEFAEVKLSSVIDFSIESNLCGNSIEANSSCDILINFKPSQIQALSAVLTINMKNGDSANVLLNGSGVSPGTAILSISETSLDFGSVINSTIAEREIRIKNVGTLNYLLGNIRLLTPSNGFSIASNNCPNGNLGPQVECAIKIRFSPTANGIYTGTLEIGGVNPTPVSLLGVGVTPSNGGGGTTGGGTTGGTTGGGTTGGGSVGTGCTPSGTFSFVGAASGSLGNYSLLATYNAGELACQLGARFIVAINPSNNSFYLYNYNAKAWFPLGNPVDQSFNVNVQNALANYPTSTLLPSETVEVFKNGDITAYGNWPVYAGMGLGSTALQAWNEMLASKSMPIYPTGRYAQIVVAPAPVPFTAVGYSSGTPQSFTLNAQVGVATADYYQPGSLFVAGMLTDGSLYFLDANNTWKLLPSNHGTVSNFDYSPYTYKNVSLLMNAQIPVLLNSDVTAVMGAKVLIGYGIGSTSSAAMKEMLNASFANNTGSTTGRYIQIALIDGSTNANTSDFSFGFANQSGSIRQYSFTSNYYFSASHVGKRGSIFLAVNTAGGLYFYNKSLNKWTLHDPAQLQDPAKAPSYASTIRGLDFTSFPTSYSNQIVSNADLRDFAGSEILLGYGVGNDSLAALNEMMAYRSSQYSSGRFIKVLTLPMPGFVALGQTSGTATSFTLKTALQVDYHDYQKVGYVFIGALYNGAFYCLNTALQWTTCDGGAYKQGGQILKTYDLEGYSTILANADVSEVPDAQVFMGYGIGTTPQAAWNELLQTNRYNLIATTPAPATVAFDVVNVSTPGCYKNSTETCSISAAFRVATADRSVPGLVYFFFTSDAGQTFYTINSARQVVKYDGTNGAQIYFSSTSSLGALDQVVTTYFSSQSPQLSQLEVYLGYGRNGADPIASMLDAKTYKKILAW